MNNEELLNKQKDEAYDKASKIYNQLVNESGQLTTNQTNQINDFIDSNTNRINKNVNNNISNLENANKLAQERHDKDLAMAQNDYEKYISAPISENARVTAQNALRNRQLTTNESKQAIYQEYLNASKEAKLTGDSTIAQLALEAMKTKLNLNSSMVKYNQNLALNQMDNDKSLSNDYWNRSQNIRNALNDINKLEENKRQFNETLSYQKEQDKIKNNLAEKEYQLDLNKIKKSYYKSSVKGGNNSNLTDTSKPIQTSSKSSGPKTYVTNYTPLGLSNAGKKTFDTLSTMVMINGNVTLEQIEKQIKKLPKDQQGIIASAFKGTIGNDFDKITKYTAKGVVR